MLSAPNPTINLQSSIPNNVDVSDRWYRCMFRIIRISVHRNQCLQYCLNNFYHDIGYIKNAIIVWSCIHWSKPRIPRLNDNAFVFNRVLLYNYAIYDDIDEKWLFDRVNDSSAACCIKFSDRSFTYLQPVANIKDKDIDHVENYHIIIGELMVYSSPKTLEDIYKKSMPLYSLIMSKRNNLIQLVATDKERKSEFKSRRNSMLDFPSFI